MKGLHLLEKNQNISSFRREIEMGQKNRKEYSARQICRNVSWQPVFLFLLVKVEFHINSYTTVIFLVIGRNSRYLVLLQRH